jgi:hypothetical protein
VPETLSRVRSQALAAIAGLLAVAGIGLAACSTAHPAADNQLRSCGRCPIRHRHDQACSR